MRRLIPLSYLYNKEHPKHVHQKVVNFSPLDLEGSLTGGVGYKFLMSPMD